MFFSILLQLAFYRPPNFRQLHGNDRTKLEEFWRIDGIGAFLLVAGLTLLLLGVSWGKMHKAVTTFNANCTQVASRSLEICPDFRATHHWWRSNYNLCLLGFVRFRSYSENPLLIRIQSSILGFLIHWYRCIFSKTYEDLFAWLS
jgi:hypothetical protein